MITRMMVKRMSAHHRRLRKMGREMCTITLTAGALLVAALAAPEAASGQRGGFVIGFGLGGGFTSIDGATADRQNKVALVADFKIGYAPSANLVIHLSGDSHLYSADTPGGSDAAALSVGGLGVTRFFSADSPIAYIDGSIGTATWELFEGSSTEDAGFGITGGVGFALSDIWFIDVGVLYANPEGPVDGWGLKASINVLSN